MMQAKQLPLLLTVVHIAIIGYFSLLYLVYYFTIESTLLGVLQEIFTLPMLAVQCICLLFSIYFIVKQKRKFYLYISTLALAVCCWLTIGSFF